MWVPDEGRHTGTPSLPTYGVPPLTPAFDATIYNFPISLDDDRTDDLRLRRG